MDEVDNEDSEEEEEDRENESNMNTMAMSRDINLPMYEGNPQTLCEMLFVENNFVVKVEKEGEDFYVLKCTKGIY